MKTTTRTFVAKGLTLVSTRVKHEAPKKAPPKPTNRIAIFDRSGSMGWTLGKVVDDLYAWAQKIPKGDTVTVGWFSSPGQYRFVVKGMTINDQNDLEKLKKILDACRHTIGTTCFSEIMGDLANVITDLKPLSDRFALVFFTDGCPVVSDVRKEIAAIERNLRAVSNDIGNSIYIGYGDYYNRNLMSDMAQWGGGALIHAENIEKFGVEMADFTQNTADSTPMIQIDLDPDPKRIALFTLVGKNPVPYPVDAVSIRVNPSTETVVYALTTDQSGPSAKVVGDVETQGLYGAAIVLSRMNRGDAALDVLGLLGDANIVQRFSNAYTLSEIGNAEAILAEAVIDPTKRCVGGKKPGCVPKRDAFCILDALNALIDDDEAKFYPGNPMFQYKRIGVKADLAEGYAKFEADKTAACPMNTLVMNETRPNLSIQTEIPGSIELTDECAKHGLAKQFPTHQFKNYTIIKDGAVNVAVLPCSMSEETFELLRKNGVIAATEAYEAGKIYPVNIGVLPVMNRAMAEGHKSGKKLAQGILDTYKLSARIKALKHFLGVLDPEKKSQRSDSVLSEAAVTYLAERGVGKNGYSPKTVAGEATDTYLAKEFKVSGKGFSSFPKIDEVIEKRKNGKAQTPSGAMVLVGIEEYEQLAKENPKASVLIKIVADKIKALTQELRKIRRNIQEAKFAVLLGNQWFEEFTTRENCTLEVEGVTFTFSVNEVIEKV